MALTVIHFWCGQIMVIPVFYTGDVNAGGVAFSAQNSEAHAYAKRLTTLGMSPAILIERADQTDEARILVGLQNPPLKRLDAANSA